MARPFKLMPLPYEEDALEPVVSARTLQFHYHKHHKGYVDTLNSLVAGTRFADMKLDDIVRATLGRDGTEKKIFNNAGQVWNHDFYWRSLSPGKPEPSRKLASAADRDFGGIETLVGKLVDVGKARFGSGWAWLVAKDGKLSIESTANAESPMARGVNCLLAIDVWEHAYYLDYQNERARYLAEVARLLNWEFAAENWEKTDFGRAAAE